MLAPIALDADALARHRNPDRWRSSPAARPVEYRLDSDGSGVAVSLPAPASLAEMLTVPGLDAYRRGSAILTRPRRSTAEPVAISLPDLVDALRVVLGSLPDRPDAGAPYRDVRRAASVPSPRFDAYLLGVLRVLRSTLPAVPARPKARSTARTDTDRNRDHRARVRVAEAASSLWWIDVFLTDEDDPAEPGSTITASALYALAREGLEEFAEDGEPIDEDDPDSPAFRVPRRRVFLAVASHVLGKPRRTEHGTTYTIPEAPPPMTEPVIDRASRVVAAMTVPAKVARTVRRLSAGAAAVLRLTGVADPEAYADAVEARIGAPVPPAEHDPQAAALVAALPMEIVYAVASAEDPRRAFGTFGRYWVDRHPECREAVSDAARAFGPALVGAIRYRAASALAEDA